MNDDRIQKPRSRVNKFTDSVTRFKSVTLHIYILKKKEFVIATLQDFCQINEHQS